jgi:hypothetical protein
MSTTIFIQDPEQGSFANRSTTVSPGLLEYKHKESGVASVMSRTLRQNLNTDMLNICESYLANKLSARFRGLAKYENGQVGKRPIYLTKYGQQLCGFEFNSQAPFNEVFRTKYHIKAGSRRGQVILHFPSFVPQKNLLYPKDASNFKISARLISLSDFGYDNASGAYNPISKEYHGKCDSFESGMLPILKMPVDPITTHLSIDQRELPGGTTLFLLMSVSFYRYAQGKFTHLEKNSSMQIKQVF